MRFSSLSGLKAENIFIFESGAEHVPVRDSTGGQSVEVVTNGAGGEETEIRKSAGNPGENASAVVRGKTAVRISVNKSFSVAENADLHEPENVVFRPEERKDLAKKGKFLPAVAENVPTLLFPAQRLTLFFAHSGRWR
ncbi:hypothetical protein CGY26_25810, partial [Salmonella enterica]|nr:hypothetical protein [Salmonella enterica]